jgi:two-component system, LytTR family, sensor kinase
MIKIDKYFKLEWFFFLLIYLIFPILTDFEYSINEERAQQTRDTIQINILRRVLFMVFQIVPFIFLYYVIVKENLVKGYYFRATIYFVIYLIVLHLYFGYIKFPLIANSTILPNSITKPYQEISQNFKLANFGIVYMFHQFLQIAALGYFINYDKKREEAQELKQGKLLSDINALKAQMHPHFLFNTLNNLYSLAEEKSSQTAPLIAKVADIMRYLLEASQKDLVPLAEELSFVDNYFEIQRIRYQDRHQISLNMEGDLKDLNIAPLILLPFVENSFKHGLENAIDDSYVKVFILIHEKSFLMQVTNSVNNNSSVMENFDTANRKGVGLENVKRRLQLEYGDSYQLDIFKSDNEYKVILKIELV